MKVSNIEMTRFWHLSSLIFPFLASFLIPSAAFASSSSSEGNDNAQLFEREEGTILFEEDPVQPLTDRRNLFSVGFWKGYPVLKMKQTLKPSTTLSPVFGYHYLFEKDWLLGVMGGFLRYDPKGHGLPAVHLLTFKFDSSYIMRLHHPIYLALGTGFVYLFPSIEATLPLDKHPRESFEIGGNFHAKFILNRGDGDLVTFEVARFRGTKTYGLYSDMARLSYSWSL